MFTSILGAIAALGTILKLIAPYLPDPKKERAQFIDQAARNQQERQDETKNLP